jgi:hypothetical protein
MKEKKEKKKKKNVKKYIDSYNILSPGVFVYKRIYI